MRLNILQESTLSLLKHMRKKNLSPKLKILFLMYVYYQIIVLYALAIIILINTNGMISTILKNNTLILLFPATIPFFFTLIGINQISTYTKKDLLKIKSINIFSWFSKDRVKFIQISNSSSLKVSEKSKYFGLKKYLIISINPENKHILNVSTLTKEVKKKLIDDIYKMKINK